MSPAVWKGAFKETVIQVWHRRSRTTPSLENGESAAIQEASDAARRIEAALETYAAEDAGIHRVEESQYRHVFLVRGGVPAWMSEFLPPGKSICDIGEMVIKTVKHLEGGYPLTEKAHFDLAHEDDLMRRANELAKSCGRLRESPFPQNYHVSYTAAERARGRHLPVGFAIQEFLVHETIKDFRRMLKRYLGAGVVKAAQLRKRLAVQLRTYLSDVDGWFRKIGLRYSDLHTRNLGVGLIHGGQFVTLEQLISDTSLTADSVQIRFRFFEAGGGGWNETCGGIRGDIGTAFDAEQLSFQERTRSAA